MPKVGFSGFEARAATELVSGPTEEVLAYARERASAYASGDPGARRRSLARAATVADLAMQEASALLTAAAARADERAVRILDRVVTGATSRYIALLEALRAESAPTRRITATANGTFTVSAEEHA